MNSIRKIAVLLPLLAMAHLSNANDELAVPGIEPVHTQPEKAEELPYSPGIAVSGDMEIIFLAGATASPLYHKHPHDPKEHIQPDDIVEQTRRVMDNIESVLNARGATFRNVVMINKYITDMREADAMHRTMGEYLKDWKPASTLVEINSLSSPGARVEIEMIAAVPQKK